MRWRRRTSPAPRIPTASMADISFLLMIFFMMSTAFAPWRGLPVELPEAHGAERVEGRRDVVTVWVAADGRIAVDGANVELQQVGGAVGPRVAASPRALVAIRADAGLRFGPISDLLQQLRGAGVLAVTFSTRLPER